MRRESVCPLPQGQTSLPLFDFFEVKKEGSILPMNKFKIVCYGDSNTWGYNPAQNGARYDDDIRWTQRLQDKLGKDFQVVEEGFSGRTTVFEDPVLEGANGLAPFHSIMISQSPMDLLVIMLGTNDCKELFSANAMKITAGMRRLILKAQGMDIWRKRPQILLVAPVCIGEKIYDLPDFSMGALCVEKSRRLPALFQALAEETGCYFMDANDCAATGTIDYLHFTPESHASFAEGIYSRIESLLPSLK